MSEAAERELAEWRAGNPSDDLWRVRMEQAEAERDEARAEVERLRAALSVLLGAVERGDHKAKAIDGARAALKPRGFAPGWLLALLTCTTSLLLAWAVAREAHLRDERRVTERQAEAVAHCRDLVALEQAVNDVCLATLEDCAGIVAGGQVVTMPPLAVEVRR